MQSVLSRIWTRVAVSISNDDNHYTTDTSIYAFVNVSQNFFLHTVLSNTIFLNRYIWPINRTRCENCLILNLFKAPFGGVTVSKLDYQTYTSEFVSQWVPHSFGLVPHRSKELRKLILYLFMLICTSSKYKENFLKRKISNQETNNSVNFRLIIWNRF